MTPAYASPEMLDGKEPTPSDDVFALAIVAFELLTGRHPFDSERPDAARFAAVRPAAAGTLAPAAKIADACVRCRPRLPTHERGRFLREFDGRARSNGPCKPSRRPRSYCRSSSTGFGAKRPARRCVRRPCARGARAVRARRERRADGVSFGAAGINEALLYFSSAYELHPNIARAVRGLETVADRFLASVPLPTRPRAARSSACSTATTT